VCIRTPSGDQWTYGDLECQSAQLAHVLQQLGVRPGDRVAVQAEKCPEIFSLNIACARVGAVYVPLNDTYTSQELVGLLDDCAPTLCVVDELLDLKVSQITLRSLLNNAVDKPREFTDVSRGDADPAAILFTSGTTGRPKGAVLSHGNLVAGSLTLSGFWEMDENDVLLHTLPIFHVHGLYVAAYNTLVRGGSMMLLGAFNVDDIIRELPHATVLMGVPTHYTRLLANERFNAQLAGHVRLFTSGSAPMLATTHEQFVARTGHTIVERYGLTETHILTSNPYNGERKLGTVGLPLPGVNLRLAPETNEIEVTGPTVFTGYWNRPELCGTEFTSDGWFKTGDIGRIDTDGYVEIIGRSKDLIITGGFNVYPAEVEAAINDMPGVQESAVVGLPHADFGEGVLAVVVAKAGALVDPGQLIAELKTQLAAFKVPKQVVVTAELPRNAMGKVQKNILRAHYDAIFQPRSES
jgi:malonyl-CoA/methylmalonyl-CoA synthetase